MTTRGRMLGHLARRFFTSLSRREPTATDEAWARSQLLPGEADVWTRMDAADRRHAIGVARRVGSRDRAVLAAALLHDAGKAESALHPVGRAIATVAGMVRPRERWRGRVGAYLHHDALGAEMLERAGSDPLTVAWAREHHLAPDRWTIPAEIGAALKAADDD